PEELDTHLKEIDTHFDLLTEAQRQEVEHIFEYLEYDDLQAAHLATVDATIKEIQQTLAQETDIKKLAQYMQQAEQLQQHWHEQLEENELLHKDSWISRMTKQKVQTIVSLVPVIQKKESSLLDVVLTNAKKFIAENPTDGDRVAQEL